MAEVRGINDFLRGFYSDSVAFNVLFFAILLAIVSLFIWNFYKSISKRNLIELNLSKYNTSEHPLASKFFATILYFLEYIVIMPLLIIFWYAALSLVLFLIASEFSVHGVLFVSAVIIGAVRILAYFHSEIAKDLSKLFPFIALSVFLLSFENIGNVFNFDAVLSKAYEIPVYYSEIYSFILVVLAIEIFLRFIYTIYEFWRSEEKANAEVLSKKANDDD